MRLHRFYIDTPIENAKLSIKDERLIHQWRNVFRYNVGSKVILFDGSGIEYKCVIEKLGNRSAELVVVLSRKGIVPNQKIVLCQSLIKKDKMEWIIEKATELGVSKIIPILSERSEKKSLNFERADKIAVEASEQCGRADILEIGEIMNLESCIKNYGENSIILDPSGSSLHNSDSIIHNSLSLFVGPEGGWSDRELELFKKIKKAQVISLGLLTLRSETAAIFALSVFQIV